MFFPLKGTFIRVAPWRHPYDLIYALSIPLVVHGMLRFIGRAVRRLLRFRFQARLQYQGLWGQHPRTWWYDRSDGLPVRRSRPQCDDDRI